MKATIKGITVEGTPEEIAAYVMIMTPSIVVRDIREESYRERGIIISPDAVGKGDITPMTREEMKEYVEKMSRNAQNELCQIANDEVYDTQG